MKQIFQDEMKSRFENIGCFILPKKILISIFCF